MKVLVIGATGETGRETIRQAVERGHAVTAFVRDPAKLETFEGRVKVVTGSLPGNVEALAQATQEQEAVISALGSSDSLDPKGLMAQSVPVIVRAMESVGVRRLVFTSAFGVGEQRGDPPLPLPTRMVKRIYIALILKRIFADKAVGERILMASTLDWTIVHPTMLTNGPRTERYRAGEHLPLRGIPRISRADTADFLLSQLDDRTYVRKIVVVSD